VDGSQLELTIPEWKQLIRLSNFFKTFFIATVKLSCSYSPTAFELLKQLYLISKVYLELDIAENRDNSLAPIVDAMKEKFLKYWEDVPLVAIIASVLNPSYKKHFTKRMLFAYKTNLRLDNTGVEAEVDRGIGEMFALYNSRINNQPSSSRVGTRYELKYTCVF
jgi:hypothetical protein